MNEHELIKRLYRELGRGPSAKEFEDYACLRTGSDIFKRRNRDLMKWLQVNGQHYRYERRVVKDFSPRPVVVGLPPLPDDFEFDPQDKSIIQLKQGVIYD